jgi:hypothetical protein
LQEDAVGEMPVLPPHEVVKPSEMNDEKEQKVSVSGNVSSAYPVLDDMHPGSVISGSQSEATDISSRGWATERDPPIAIEELYLEGKIQLPNKDSSHYLHFFSVDRSYNSMNNCADATVPQIPVVSTAELPEVLGETESRQMASDSSINPYISQFTILEQHYVVLEDKKIKGIIS